MRQESALVRPDAHAGERLVHLVVQDFQRCMGSDADPEVVGPSPPVELADAVERDLEAAMRSEEHTSELQSLMRNSYAVFCLKKKTRHHKRRLQNEIVHVTMASNRD